MDTAAGIFECCVKKADANGAGGIILLMVPWHKQERPVHYRLLQPHPAQDGWLGVEAYDVSLADGLQPVKDALKHGDILPQMRARFGLLQHDKKQHSWALSMMGVLEGPVLACLCPVPLSSQWDSVAVARPNHS